MKFPRDVPGTRVVALLQSMGYSVVRQRGSHIRLRRDEAPAHSVTVPNHNPLKVGTLKAIFSEIADRHGIEVEELVQRL